MTAARIPLDGEMQLLGLMPNASNYTFLARIPDGGEGALVIYKPRAGETPLWDFPEGTLCLREVAAWEVSDALGWSLVPETVLRDGPHGIGSAQRFIAFDPEQHYFTLRETRLEDFRDVALLDAIINNADRKGGHCLLGHDGELRLIDHGVCFHPEPKLRTVVWDFAGEFVDAGLLDTLASARDAILERTGSLLDPLESKALGARIDGLLARGTYPVPGAERHYPWPPV
jgi:hypothetical protein